MSAGPLSRGSNRTKWDRLRGWRLAKVARQEVQGFDYVSREQCDGFVGQCADRSLIIPKYGCGRNHPESSDSLRALRKHNHTHAWPSTLAQNSVLMKFKCPWRVRRHGQQPPALASVQPRLRGICQGRPRSWSHRKRSKLQLRLLS